MKSQKEQIALYLMNDAQLIAMLAPNAPWNTKGGAASQQNSIIPAQKAPLTNGPYLTIASLADNQNGTNLVDAFYLIRCYNASDKTYVSIDEILSRVKALLHRHRFNYDDSTVSIDTYYESTGAEFTDDAFQQNFRESQYRVQYL